MHPDHELEQYYTQSHLPGVPRPFHQLPPEERIDWAKRMEKAQFEAWAKLHRYDLVRCSHEPYAAYRSDLTNAALAGWRGGNGEASPQPDERAAFEGQLLALAREFANKYSGASNANQLQAEIDFCKALREFNPRATAPQATVKGDEPAAWIGLTDEDRQAAFEALPDMLEGFMKKWGWLNFAKEIERRCMEKNARAAIPQASGASRLHIWFAEDHGRARNGDHYPRVDSRPDQSPSPA